MKILNWIAVTCIVFFSASLTLTIAAEPQATPVSSIRVQPGFNVELLRSAGKGESSWISMTFDDRDD